MEDNKKRRFLFEFRYDGAGYVGWQVQPNGESIQGTCQSALKKITGENIKLVASGRTDAGVHALAHPAHTDIHTRLTCGELMRAMNALLPDSIVVVSVREVAKNFHAQKDSINKTYRYTIATGTIRPVHERGYVWHVPRTLSLYAIQKGAKHLEGTHDFTSFESVGRPVKSGVRTIERISVGKRAGLIVITITGDGFLKQMVRNIVGSLVEVGLGKHDPGWIKTVLELKDRTQAGPCAPAKGLFLVKVSYRNL